jgi:hypothetical protein
MSPTKTKTEEPPTKTDEPPHARTGAEDLTRTPRVR